jgi:serine/threonine-protein kinase RsbW
VETEDVCSATTLRLPFSPASVCAARRRLRGWLADNDVDGDSIEDARVVVSELVANSVRHARPLPDGSILVSWTRKADGVLVSVTDGGSGTRPRPVRASSTAVAGRGMAIVDMLAEEWWAERTRTRCTVHALLPV